jgi:hypothetical protein
MKKLIASLAVVAILAVPALADLSEPIVIRKGQYTLEPAPDVESTRHDPANLEGNYNNLQLGHPQTQYRIPNNQGFFVGDDLHMVGTSVTGYRWVYSDPGDGGDGPGGVLVSHSSSMAFFNMATPNDGGPLLGNTVMFTSGGSTFAAVFNVTGLPEATTNNPGGGWLITVGLPTLTTAMDIWVGFKSNSMTAPNPATTGLRGTNLSPGPAHPNEGVGSSHNLHWSGFAASPPYTAFFSHPGGGNFRQAALPEPGIAGLLALGGLLVLRRRK